MKKIIINAVFASVALVFGIGCAPKIVNQTAPKMKYPDTKKVSQTDDYFGTKVADPYRWLENDTAAEVEAWVSKQNKITFDYLSQIPYREAIKARYRELFNYAKLSSPFRAGDYYFFYKNDGLQNQAVLYRQKGLNGAPEVFIDPNALSKAGTTAVNVLSFSSDNRYMAYSIQKAGSDWSEIRLKEVATNRDLPDVLEWVKFSGAAWKGNGFYYSRYPAPSSGTELSAANEFHSVYYHKIGDAQSADELVYRNEKAPKMYHFVSITEDETVLTLNASTGTDGFELYFKDLRKGGDWKPLFTGFEHKNYVIDHQDGKLLMLTDVDAPNYRLVSVPLENPDKGNWKEVIPQKAAVLDGVNICGGKLFAFYLEKATTRVYQYDYDGKNERAIALPGLGSASGFGGKRDEKETFFTFTSFTYPNTIFQYDLQTGVSKPFFKPDLKFNPEDYVEKQVTYRSKDGTEVSMFVVHKKGLVLDSKRPCYLYGYGGFNVNLTPGFGASRLLLLENDGVFAMPNLRGGGEYGESWHKDGMLFKKQNVFDDFIAAAEFLIKEGYTDRAHLAIAGGSNGGLLVGACMTQRPDLYAVAFPAVGVMDMLRYHKFTVGWGWVPEYGSSEQSEASFKNLYAYSPLHNLKPNQYPATLVTTADHDDRVVPAHSFKFAAQLQLSQKGERPTLIRIEQNAGHGAGKPTEKVIEEQADIWSFLFYNTGSPVKYLKK